MFKNNAIITLALLLAVVGIASGETLETQWNEFLHYTQIGRLDMAKAYADQIIDSEADPVELLELSKDNPTGYNLLLRMYANSEELKAIAGSLLGIIEEGRYVKRTDSAIIAEEIRRLSSTTRGKLKAIERLKNAGEYAVPLMLDVMADSSRKSEFANVAPGLSKIGRDAIRPLAAALQMDDIAIKAEVVNALGEIGYPQAIPYLKYVMEFDSSLELRDMAKEAIVKIDAEALKLSAAELFYSLAENYYYHRESLAVRSGYDFGNVWFWNAVDGRVVLEQVDISYFYYVMSMRCSEWALKADANLGKAIGLWVAAYYRAESTGVDMPKYFGDGHADAATYASTAGAKYLHQSLKRAISDKDAYVALGVVEALASNAGEVSLLYRVGLNQPLLDALSFDDKSVKYSAAIAIAMAGPDKGFPESSLIIKNLADAIGDNADMSQELADEYALRSVAAMLKLAIERSDVVNLMSAKEALIDSTQGDKIVMQVLAGQVLARLNSPEAQKAVAVMALDETLDNNVRIEAFKSLAISAKLNGSLLGQDQIDGIYQLVGDDLADAAVRAAAAGAYGALNLPSEQVKQLILDQSKS